MERLIRRAGLEEIHRKVLAGERLSFEEGVRLYGTPELTAVGYLANLVRERRHGDRAYWVRNQHINYTNICNKDCSFCSFYAKKGGPAPYTLSVDQIREKVRQYREIPITEIHMVGGINPRLPYQYYLDIVRAIKEERPQAHLKAYTMIELEEIHRVSGKSLEDVLEDLKAAGVESMPGGGAEILSARLHQELFKRKLDFEGWLRMARAAHRAGLRSNATMLYGHIESAEERVEHLLRLRELQDETGGFVTFIPLAFDPKGTELSHLPNTTGVEDLRAIAVARLMLDNFEHIKAFWVMITPPVAQTALWYGADDLDGTIQEYEITHVGTESNRQVLTHGQLLGLIEEAGRVPVERDTLYNVVEMAA
ncbi:MAG TPA: aminofutalosine synthase MqnE [Armatimonadota bacterium]|jgi:aminodeoxyfutalosine synthase